MSQRKSISVRLVSPRGKSSSGSVQVEAWERPERLKRAWKNLGIIWGMAVVAVFIPGLHFILVPLFLAAGPAFAYFTFCQSDVVLGGEGTCPECGKPFKIERSAVKWPLKDLCSACQNSVDVELIQ